MSRRHVTAGDVLTCTGGLLTRSHLRELGLERRAIDAVFRLCPVVPARTPAAGVRGEGAPNGDAPFGEALSAALEAAR